MKPVMQAFLIISLLLIAVPLFSCTGNDYIIDGNSIIYEDSDSYFKVTPHTLTASGWVEIEFSSSIYSGLADVVCGFDSTLLDLSKVQTWESYEHTLYKRVEVVEDKVFTPEEIIEVKEILDWSKGLNEHTAEVTCIVNGIESTATIHYNKYDGESFYYKSSSYINQPYYETYPDWHDIPTDKEEKTINYKGSLYWKSRDIQVPVQLDTLNKARVWIDIPFNSSGKYSIGIKPSSKSIDTAKNDNTLWILDPWYNASWAYRKEITVTNASADYQTLVMVGKTADAVGEDVDCGGHVLDTFADLRFTSDDGETLIDYCILKVSDSGGTKLATVWVQNNSDPDTTLYMYYGNAGASSASSGANTFIVYDDFERGNDGDPIGGDWTIDAGDIDISDEQAYSGTRSGKWIGGATKPDGYITVANSEDIAIRFELYRVQYAQVYMYHGQGSKNAAPLVYYEDSIEYYYNDWSVQDTGQDDTHSQWDRLELNDFDWSGYTYDIIYDGGSIADDAVMLNNTINDIFYIHGENAATYNFYIDNFIVRKWASTEPSFAFGSEQALAVPDVTTSDATNVEETTATLGGNITDVNYDNATTRGIEYDTDSGAPYTNDWHEDGDFGTGAYSHGESGLTKGELYYFRAYATNAGGTGYGSEKTFLTKPDEPNTFTAVSGGTTSIDLTWNKGTGAQNTIIRGKEGSYPTDINDGDLVYNNTGTSTSHTGLDPNEHWYYRAWSYATEGALEQYSDAYDEDNATTDVATPTITTSDATNIEETTVTLGGNITDIGGENCTVRGFEYDTDSGAPYTNDWHENGSFGTGAYSNGEVGLTQGELYYFRAYATNTGGTGYGTEKTFLTKPVEPDSLTATGGVGQVGLTWNKGTGAQNTYIRGKQGSYPTDRADGTLIYNNTGTSTTHSGLGAGQTWYYRAWSYATEGALEQYSDAYDEDSATTVAAGAKPDVATIECVGFDSDWAILSGKVTDDKSTAITQYGFDYGLDAVDESDVTTTQTIGEEYPFHYKLTGLTPATSYMWRAKAYNVNGWGAGGTKYFATKGSPAIYENYQTGGNNDSIDIYGQNWAYQVVTSNTTAHTMTSMVLYIKRTGSPGDITVSLRHVSANKPTGLDLETVSGEDVLAVIDGDTISDSYNWVEFEVPEFSMEGDTEYAIVVRALDGDDSNDVQWKINDAGGYSTGLYGTTADGGITWSTTADDAIFMIYGNPCLAIQDAKVFTGYMETGDWLIAIRYINTYPPFYDTYDPKKEFVFQIAPSDNVTAVKAQTSMPAWGNRVGSIYLSADSVSSLQYGDDYYIIMRGLSGSNPYTAYSLEGDDWLGSDLTNLDSWVMSSIAVISTYYDTTLTTYVAGRGECLNATGGSICTQGINGLSTCRPELFETYTQAGDYDPEAWTQSYRLNLGNWQANVGVDTTAAMTRVGNLVGVSGDMIIVFLLVLVMILLGVLAFPAGHTTAALVLSCGFLFAAIGFGLDIVWIAILALIAAFLFVKQMWFNTGA